MGTTEPPITVDPDLIPLPGQKYMMWADYFIFALIMVVYIVIGLVQSFGARKPESAKDFMNASGQMPVIPVVLSLLSSVLSAIIILGGAAEIYTQGAMYWLQGIGQWLATIMAALLFVPLLYPLKLTSSYEYLELRFKSRTVKICGMLYLVVSQLFYMGVCIYSPATALEAVTGFPETGSIVIGSVVAGLYCILGGMKGSIWVGAVQALLMLFGTLVAIIKPSIDHPDGIRGLWNINKETERLDMWDFDPSPMNRHTFFTLVFGNFVGWLSTYGVNQASVQRYCSVGSQNKGMLVVFLNGPGLMLVTTLCALSGGTIFAWYYYVGCDPLAAGYLSNANQVLPFYIMDRMDYPCVPGLFMAGLFAGALSSISGSLGALASVTWQDLFEWKFHDISDRAKMIIQKVLMVIFTGAGIGFAFMVRTFGGTVLQGATVGSLVALAFALWLVIGSYTAGIALPQLPTSTEQCFNYTPPSLNGTEPPKFPEDVEGIEKLYLLSYLYFAAMGVAITIVLGLIVSFFAGCTQPKDADPRLHVPLADRIFCCVRDKTLTTLRYGWSKADLLRPLRDDDEDSLSRSSSSSGSSSSSLGRAYNNPAFESDLRKDGVGLGKLREFRDEKPPAYNGHREAPYTVTQRANGAHYPADKKQPDMLVEDSTFF